MGHETRTVQLWGWTQTSAPTGLEREGSGQCGGEAREKPLHCAASSRQAPDERERERPEECSRPSFPLPRRSRAFIHFKSGLLWAFAGVRGHLGEEIPHTALLSTKQINLPGSSGLPTLGSSLHAVLHVPIKPTPQLAPPPKGQQCSGWQGPEPAPRSAQRKGQADLYQLLS